MLSNRSSAEAENTTTQLDQFHAAIVDRAMASDAARVAAGEVEFLRLAEPHEFCHPAFPCLTWPSVVVVTAVRPGIRMRRPIAARAVAA